MNTEQLKQIIYDEACRYFGMNLKSKRKFRELVEARRFTISYMLQICDCSLQKVGKIFAHRDHSTIIHARNDHEFKIKHYTADRERWEKFKMHMDMRLLANKEVDFMVKLTDPLAIKNARDLLEADALGEFIQHQLIAL